MVRIPPTHQSCRPPKVSIAAQESEMRPGRVPKSEVDQPEKLLEQDFGLSIEQGLIALLNQRHVMLAL